MLCPQQSTFIKRMEEAMLDLSPSLLGSLFIAAICIVTGVVGGWLSYRVFVQIFPHAKVICGVLSASFVFIGLGTFLVGINDVASKIGVRPLIGSGQLHGLAATVGFDIVLVGCLAFAIWSAWIFLLLHLYSVRVISIQESRFEPLRESSLEQKHLHATAGAIGAAVILVTMSFAFVTFDSGSTLSLRSIAVGVISGSVVYCIVFLGLLFWFRHDLINS